jgi:DNA-binding transcriptional MerR regulator
VRIGELSSRTGASRRSLRYYEEQGLVVSTRSPSGQRHYDDEQVRRVELIQTFFAAGMSSRTILQMVPCMVASPSVQASVQAMETMDAERRRLTSVIDDLVTARVTLDGLIQANDRYRADVSSSPRSSASAS